MRSKKIVFPRPFEKMFSRLPGDIRKLIYQKIELFLRDPTHPSLRVKRIKGTDCLWEMSITMNSRLTFEVSPEELFLRKIGTHDVLNNP
ncbi:MAG: hypothetical protein ABH952_12715 [Candidatus Omnitrophota bacterium]